MGTYLPKDYWTDWDVWAHKYGIIGLLEYYKTTGDAQALSAAMKAADLLYRTFVIGNRDINLSGGHQGMASGSVLVAMADLYAYTGNAMYLQFCKYILTAWESSTGPHIVSNI